MTDDQSQFRIHIGCGNEYSPGWTNFDSSPYVRLRALPLFGRLFRRASRKFHPDIRYGDVTASQLCEPGTATAIYASHVLEHMAFDDARDALRNIYSMLAPGGVFRLVVPDLHWRAGLYIEQMADSDADAANRLIESLNMGMTGRKGGLVARLRHGFSNSSHQWMYDEFSLQKVLLEHGFSTVRRCEFGDSGLSYFDDVENLDRFVNKGSGLPELAFHCKR